MFKLKNKKRNDPVHKIKFPPNWILHYIGWLSLPCGPPYRYLSPSCYNQACDCHPEKRIYKINAIYVTSFSAIVHHSMRLLTGETRPGAIKISTDPWLPFQDKKNPKSHDYMAALSVMWPSVTSRHSSCSHQTVVAQVVCKCNWSAALTVGFPSSSTTLHEVRTSFTPSVYFRWASSGLQLHLR